MVFCGDDVATEVKDALTYCYRCKGRKVTLSDHEDNDDNKPIGDFDYDHDVTKRKKLITLPLYFLFAFFYNTSSTTRVCFVNVIGFRLLFSRSEVGLWRN